MNWNDKYTFTIIPFILLHIFLMPSYLLTKTKNMRGNKISRGKFYYELHPVWCVSCYGEIPTISCTLLLSPPRWLRRFFCGPSSHNTDSIRQHPTEHSCMVSRLTFIVSNKLCGLIAFIQFIISRKFDFFSVLIKTITMKKTHLCSI